MSCYDLSENKAICIVLYCIGNWAQDLDPCQYYLRLGVLTLCVLGKFSCFCYRLLTFFSKLTFSKKSFRNAIRLFNGLGLDQDRHFVGPDLGPNCLQRLSADDESRR